jgi:hypothetical protein
VTAPKLFVSYSWSNDDHEQWVLKLATELRESGVDVILDKWDLKEGHDSLVFMERMVADPEVKKVIMVCDETYAAKADGRAGGVGTETQIISPNVYAQTSQDKFVAIIAARDSDGRPYLPTYYKSRIYIDLSEEDRYAEEFERLLRWIYDKPLNVKPELGSPPAFLSDSEQVSLGTTPAHRRALDAIRNQRGHAQGALEEYFSVFARNLERFRIAGSAADFDDTVVRSITELLPYRNEFIQLVSTIAQYAPQDPFARKFHRFFEQLIPYFDRPPGASQWQVWDFDNFKFFVDELFLYALAIFIKHERFSQAAILLAEQYYDPRRQEEHGLDPMVGFTTFSHFLQSMERRNQRLQLRKLSVRALILNERSTGSGIEWRDLMQADFIAYLRAELHAGDGSGGWVPDAQVYAGNLRGPFEIFARARSKSYFDKIKVLLGVNSKDDIEALLRLYQEGRRTLPRFGWPHEFNPAERVNWPQLAVEP